MAGGNGRKKRKRTRGRRTKRKPGGSSSSSASSDDVSPQPVEHQGGLVVRDDYEWGWHNALFVGTKGSVDIMASVRDQILKTCFICAILYAAEQDIRRWLAIEEPDRQPEIYFDFDTYVAQYEAEVKALIGQNVSSFYRTRDDMPRNALKVFLRDGVMAYSKSKEWPGGKIIKITHFLFHKDMIFTEFEDIIASGGSIIGGFPVGLEFKDLKPDAIYQFSPPGIKRQSAGAHMVQFIGTGIDVEREFLVFLHSKKRFGKDGVGKVYFDQIYNGVYTLECRAPPLPPPSDDPDLIASGADDNDYTLGSSGAAPDGNNKPSFSGAPYGNEVQSSTSTAPTASFTQVRKCNTYDDDPISSSCTIKRDGWVLSAPALLIEDIQTRTECKNCGPWKKENLHEIGTVTRCFVPSNNMNDLNLVNVLLKICDKHCQMIPIVSKIPTLLLGRDLSHSFPGLSYIPSSARVFKCQQGRKHKQPISSSGPANSSCTMNTGPFPSLASTNPFTNTASMPFMHHNATISSPLALFGADATGIRESPTDQIVDMCCFLEDGRLGHKVDLFFSRDDSSGFTFREIYLAGVSANKVACFHSSSDGKLLATGGHNMKESQHLENREGLLKSQAARAVKQKEHMMASWIYSLAICHKESAALYANRRLWKPLMGDGEDALRCRMLRPDWAKACYRQAAAHMLLKEYEQAPDALLDAQKLYPGNAEIESERKAWELVKNPPVESVH